VGCWYNNKKVRAVILAEHCLFCHAVQFELHPRRQEVALRQACAAAGVAVVAYASLGCGDLLQQPVVQQVAARTGKTESQVGPAAAVLAGIRKDI
jgi:diketogulonate reductase-like aldo/keto reductase